MWILAHGKILSNRERWRRHLSASPRCTRCDAEIEDACHVVRDCTDSKEIWECFIPLSLSGSFYTDDLQDWMLRSLKFREEDATGGC